MWQNKRKVGIDDGEPTAMELEMKSVGRTTKGEDDDINLNNFFDSLGASVEAFIDASPLGVSTPVEPWNPSTDKKKAYLSNPMSVLNSVTERIDAVSPKRFRVGSSSSSSSSSSAGNMWGMTLMLMSLREGLSNATTLVGEKNTVEDVDSPPVIINKEIDVNVSTEVDEEFVDVGADRWGNTARPVNVVKETVSEVKVLKKAISHFITKKALPFLDNITLRANGIVVTSDDCSVECSIASLVDDKSYLDSPDSPGSLYTTDVSISDEDCPSVITEGPQDEIEEDMEEKKTTKDEDQEVVEIEVVKDVDSDDEYVITSQEELADIDDADFEVIDCP